jgi:hypothetical protein
VHMKPLSIAVLVAILALMALPAPAQPVISAKSGVVSDVLGKVYLGDQLIEPSLTKFPDVKENAILRTAEGRAEVLLPPGVFLRLGENSSFRMITNRLIDTRIELLSGSAIIEAVELTKDTNVTVVARDATITLDKAGLYRFDMEPARVKVFKGAASVAIAGQNVAVPGGKMLPLSGTASLEKFNTDDTDSIENWNQRRSQYVAMANLSAAKYAQTGYAGLNGNSWGWNPFYGMYTYIPLRGSACNFYGYCYYSPSSVNQVYYQASSPSGGGGFNGPSYRSMPGTSSGYSGTMASSGVSMSSGVSSSAASVSSGSTAASSAGSSSVGHGSAGGGGRGR